MAEDVAQEAFLLAFKALPQLHDPTKFGPWLSAITRNRARRVGAKESRNRADRSGDIDRLILNHSQEIGACSTRQGLDHYEGDSVRQLLEQLPTDYRTPLQLYYYEE